MASVTFKGNPVSLTGNEIAVGDSAPDFTCQRIDMTPYSLGTSPNTTKILTSIPSLDTPVCDMETRRFNDAASSIDGVEIVCISMDLPFAQKRWCGAAGIDKVVTVSDHQAAAFGKNYGVLIEGGPLDRLLARAVFVVGPDGNVRHVEYVHDIAEHPDYDAALAAARGDS